MEKPFKPGWLLLGIFSWLILIYLIAPILVIVPLSFNIEPYMSYPMAGFSLRWYQAVLTSPQWISALKSSLIVGVCTTIIATMLGTMAAFGLVRKGLPKAQMVMGILLMPLAIPVVTVALALYIVFSYIGLTNSYLGLIIAHTVLATPFVLVTVTASLANFDFTLLRAGASLGAGPLTVFRRVTFPLIKPGVATGALFAFITSWDEVVVALFIAGPEQRTLPRQMFAGLREQLDPSILVVASLFIAISLCLSLFGFFIKWSGKKTV